MGNELPPGSPISFLFWFAEQKLLSPDLIPVPLSEFVVTALCNPRPMVESSNAMAYELLNLTTLHWHADVIRGLGLDGLCWPEIVEHGHIVGKMKLGGKQIPCYTPVGDYQCALAGALIDEGELSLNISTGSQVSRLTRALQLGDYQSRPFFDGIFTNLLSHLPAGRSLNVLVKLITEFSQANGVTADPWDYIIASLASGQQGDLKVDLGFFPGPCGLNGAISGIREDNLTVSSLFHAAFENMAANYSACAGRVWPERSWSNLVFSGGVARKLPELRALIESKLQTGSRLCPLEEDTLLGLTVLALFFSRRTNSVAAAMQKVRQYYSTYSHERQGSLS